MSPGAPPTRSHPSPPRSPPLSGLRLLRGGVAPRPPATRRPRSDRWVPCPGRRAASPSRDPRLVGGGRGRSARPAPARLVTLQLPRPEVPDRPKSLPGRGEAVASEELRDEEVGAAAAAGPRTAAPPSRGPARNPHRGLTGRARGCPPLPNPKLLSFLVWARAYLRLPSGVTCRGLRQSSRPSPDSELTESPRYRWYIREIKRTILDARAFSVGSCAQKIAPNAGQPEGPELPNDKSSHTTKLHANCALA
nr:proline-rich protein 2-like [Manis javanica]